LKTKRWRKIRLEQKKRHTARSAKKDARK
jgi:hypothetical protein